MCDAFQRHVAPVPDGPFIVLFEEERADGAGDGIDQLSFREERDRGALERQVRSAAGDTAELRVATGLPGVKIAREADTPLLRNALGGVPMVAPSGCECDVAEWPRSDADVVQSGKRYPFDWPTARL